MRHLRAFLARRWGWDSPALLAARTFQWHLRESATHVAFSDFVPVSSFGFRVSDLGNSPSGSELLLHQRPAGGGRRSRSST
jgi:hypothetical protein